MRKIPFNPLTTLPLQTLAAMALNSTPVAINSLLLQRSADPVASPAIGFGDVTPHFQFSKSDQHVIAVITLISNYFSDALRMHCALAFRLHIDQFGHCDARLNHGSGHRRGVGGGAAMRSDSNDGARSISTAFSALYANAVRPSFSLVISACSSIGCFQSSLELFLLRLRSMRRNAAPSLASIPSVSARRFRYVV